MSLNMIYKDITSEEFDQRVLRESKIALVKFRASWSGSCQILAPIFSELSKLYHHRINFFTVDIDKNNTSAVHYGVHELPDILFFRNGELLDRVTGAAPQSMLTSKIEKILSLKK